MLPRVHRRRVVLLAILVAALAGFVAGWFARLWSRPSVEERAHETLEEIRGRARDLTK